MAALLHISLMHKIEYSTLTDIESLHHVAVWQRSNRVLVFVGDKLPDATHQAIVNGQRTSNARYVASAAQKDWFAERDARKETL